MHIALIFICIVIFLAGELSTVKLVKTGERICTHGIHGNGIIKSFDRIITWRYYLFYPQYIPKVEFYIGTKCYTMPAIGIFHKRQWKVGEEVEIVYWDECDEYIVLKGFDFKKSYVFSIVSYSILTLIAVILLLISYI